MQTAYLCIDTISSAAGITVLKEDFAHHSPLNPQMASEGIIELIDQALKKSKIELSDLAGVFVIKGPGSFTGLRVGISVANQFAHQLKIPILGLKTDEWWLLRGNEGEKLFLQSMNKQEIYCADAEHSQIIAIEKLSEFGEREWLGELKFDHQEKLPFNFQEIVALDSVEKTWEKLIQGYSEGLKPQKTYELVEPFYGKEPNITKAKKA